MDVKPTAHTVPRCVYRVEVLFEGRSVGSHTVKWDRLPGMWEKYPEKSLDIYIPSSHRIYQLFAEDEQKPISQRNNFDVEDLVDVVVTRQSG